MELRNSKKGFVFTFLALFISLLMFAFITMDLSESEFAQTQAYNLARLNTLNAEYDFYKNDYFKDLLKYSTYNSLIVLVKNDTALNYVNGNHTKLNEVLSELVFNGSILGKGQSYLDKKNMNYLLSVYDSSFGDLYSGKINFTLKDFKVKEKQSYYLTLEIIGDFNLSTYDNISEWNSEEHFEVNFPIYQLPYPDIYRHLNVSTQFFSTELKQSAIVDTLDTFNESLANTYAKTFMQSDFYYTIGTSYLKDILNYSRLGSYKDVIGFWSFDYDEYEMGVYDSSNYHPNGKFYSSMKGSYSFDNETAYLNDSSDYRIPLVEAPGTLSYNNNSCLSRGCLFFEGVDELSIPYDDSLFNNHSLFNHSFGLSFWFKLNDTYQDILVGKDNDFNFTVVDDNLELMFQGLTIESNFINVSSNWHNVIVTYNSTEVYFYLDGEIVFYPQSINFIPTISDIFFIGDKVYFDEIQWYSRHLTEDDVARVINTRKNSNLNNFPDEFDEALYFSGGGEYALIELNNSDLINNDFTIEFWMNYGFNNDLNLSSGILSFLDSYNNYLNKFYVNNNNQLEWEKNGAAQTLNTSSLVENNWYYITATFNKGSNDVKLYVDGELKDTKIFDMSAIDTQKLQLSYFQTNSSFRGFIDEVRITNRTLTQQDITNNYLNFANYVKGCCNYLTLIDPNKFGLTAGISGHNTSFSSKLFFDYYNLSLVDHNVGLYNMTNITSYDGTDYHYFGIDQCILEAYNVLDYAIDNTDVVRDGVGINLVGDTNCFYLVREGIY